MKADAQISYQYLYPNAGGNEDYSIRIMNSGYIKMQGRYLPDAPFNYSIAVTSSDTLVVLVAPDSVYVVKSDELRIITGGGSYPKVKYVNFV